MKTSRPRSTTALMACSSTSGATETSAHGLELDDLVGVGVVGRARARVVGHPARLVPRSSPGRCAAPAAPADRRSSSENGRPSSENQRAPRMAAACALTTEASKPTLRSSCRDGERSGSHCCALHPHLDSPRPARRGRYTGRPLRECWPPPPAFPARRGRCRAGTSADQAGMDFEAAAAYADRYAPHALVVRRGERVVVRALRGRLRRRQAARALQRHEERSGACSRCARRTTVCSSSTSRSRDGRELARRRAQSARHAARAAAAHQRDRVRRSGERRADVRQGARGRDRRRAGHVFTYGGIPLQVFGAVLARKLAARAHAARVPARARARSGRRRGRRRGARSRTARSRCRPARS